MMRLAAARRVRVVLLLFVPLLWFLASCGGSGTGPSGPDPTVFTPERAFGRPAPENAEVLDPVAFEALADDDGFRWEGVQLRAAREAAAAAQLAEDLDVLEDWIADDPDLASLVEPPDPSDPDLEATDVGTFLLTFHNQADEMRTVATLGHDDEVRDLVSAGRVFEDPSNQRAVYAAGYALAPPATREGLPTPESLRDASLDDLLAANAALDAALASEVAALERSALARVRLSAQLEDPPPGFPGTWGPEERAGTGGDQAGACPFQPGGLYVNMDWPQKYFTTSVKDQGRRGSCVAFALTSATETQVAVRDARWINLSEQYLYNRIKSVWDPEHYDDGANTVDMAKTFAGGGYRLPFEDLWNYNRSPDRAVAEADSPADFLGSCIGYTETCSDTTHQGGIACTQVAGLDYCGFVAPDSNGEGARLDANAAVVWARGPWLPELPLSLLRTLLAGGQPIVASIRVTGDFRGRGLGANGYLTGIGADVEGGHAVHVTGFVANDQLPDGLPHAPGGGWLIVKNSWGSCYGDGGYVYVPVSWARFYFKHMVAFFNPDLSDVFTNTPPTLEITSPDDGASFLLGGADAVPLRASVSDAEDGSSCCTVAWTSDLDGPLGQGRVLDVALGTEGTHVVTAIATDSVGATARDSVAVEVVNEAPVPEILAPTPGEQVLEGVPYTLRGTATDAGNLGFPCEGLTWTSSRFGDPFPVIGCEAQVTFETTGTRTLTLTAEDTAGATGSTSVTFSVVPPPTLWTAITSPTEGTPYQEGVTITLSGTLSQAFERPATYTWRAYPDGTGDGVVVAEGTVLLVIPSGDLVVPKVDWLPTTDGIGTGPVSVELTVDGENGSASSPRVSVRIYKLN
jgi:hypothetical protein